MFDFNSIIVLSIYIIYMILCAYLVKRILSEEINLAISNFRILFLLGLIIFSICLCLKKPYTVIAFPIYWLLIIGYIDQKFHFIYHFTLVISIILNLVTSIYLHFNIVELFLGAVVGICIYGLIYCVAYFYYKREVFGFGDVMLMGSLGLLLGIKGTLITSILTFYVAILGIAILYLRNRNINKKTEVAFAPYMILSAILVALFEHQIIELYRSIFMI